MNPWGTKTEMCGAEVHGNQFDDSFCSKEEQNNHENEISQFVPITPIIGLPEMQDSNTYLSRLEKKLEKIEKRNAQKSSINSKSMISSLQSRKNIFFEQSLSSQIGSQMMGQVIDETFNDEGEITSSTIANELGRRFHPDQQALSKVEMLALVKHDVLSKISDDQTTNTDNTR